MIYYRVKPEYDNKIRYVWRRGQGVSNGILVANELYTEKEYSKLANYHGCFEKVEIKKTNTYFCFDCRFEYGNNFRGE